MYRIFSVLFLCLLIITSKGQEQLKKFTFSGAVSGSPSGYIYLKYYDTSGAYVQDSSLLTKGKFSFSGYINGPTVATLQSKEALADRGVEHGGYAEIYLEPAKMSGAFPANDFKHGKISGSASQKEYVDYRAQMDALDKNWKTTLDSFHNYRAGINKEQNIKVYDFGFPAYQQASRQATRHFIRSHSTSHVSAYLLVYEKLHMPLDSVKDYFNHLSVSVQKGAIGKNIAAFIEKEERIAIGKPAPDFMQPDTSGNAVWLHDYKGKYVLLDVWASWCAPCREEHPYLKQAYGKYKAKGFEILSLSIDREQDKEKWLTAIQKDGLVWKQVCDFKVFQNQVLNDYNLMGKGIPRNFLIDPKGNIVAMNLRGEEVEQKLSELLN